MKRQIAGRVADDKVVPATMLKTENARQPAGFTLTRGRDMVSVVVTLKRRSVRK